MRGRWLIVLTAVAIAIVAIASLSALRGREASSTRSGTTVNVSGLGPRQVLPVAVRLPTSHREARVFVVHPKGRRVMALLAISTHLGCRLVFHGDPSLGDGFTRLDPLQFEDPCGGSTFALDGRCVGGPCPRDLDRYRVAVVGHTATFDLHHLVRGTARSASRGS